MTDDERLLIEILHRNGYIWEGFKGVIHIHIGQGGIRDIDRSEPSLRRSILDARKQVAIKNA
jgi:hypothetical protein